MYICLEGVDGSGKSTQIQMLENWLSQLGYPVLAIYEPTDSAVGEIIRNMLRNPQASTPNFQKTLALLFAADRMLLMDKIQKAEESGQIVISDRCFYSSLVYQDHKEWISQINHYVQKPDMVILMDLEVETALKRCEGKDHFENKVFLEKIRIRYLKMGEKEHFYVINAENGVNKIHHDIKKLIAPKLGICL